jgi:hypothetical protein
MFFFVCGLPGEFTQWCENVALALAQRESSSAGLLRAETLERVALGAMGSGISHAVVSSRHPGGRLRAALAESGRNFIVVLDDPRTVLMELALGRGVDLVAAVQHLACSCATLADFADAPGALTLVRERDEPWPEETAAAIAQHLGFSIGAAELSDLVRTIADGAVERRQHDAAAWWEGLAAAQRELAVGALAPFVEDRAATNPLSIVWAPDLFFVGDRLDERVSGPVDITGRARCLLQGPHIVVPPGNWSLSLTAHFTHSAIEHEFLVEIYADKPLASGSIRPQREGAAEVTLDFAVEADIEHAVAVRISSRRAAFDGAVELVGARLVRAVESRAEPTEAAA